MDTVHTGNTELLYAITLDIALKAGEPSSDIFNFVEKKISGAIKLKGIAMYYLAQTSLKDIQTFIDAWGWVVYRNGAQQAAGSMYTIATPYIKDLGARYTVLDIDYAKGDDILVQLFPYDPLKPYTPSKDFLANLIIYLDASEEYKEYLKTVPCRVQVIETQATASTGPIAHIQAPAQDTTQAAVAPVAPAAAPGSCCCTLPDQRNDIKPGDVWDMRNGRKVRFIATNALMQESTDFLIPIALLNVYYDKHLNSTLDPIWDLMVRTRPASNEAMRG